MDACRRVNFGELPPTQAWRVDAVCQRFEAEWRAEREPRIEDFLPQADQPQRAALFRELLALELELRPDRGERLDPREYRTRFPGHTAAIEAVFGLKPAASSDAAVASTVVPAQQPLTDVTASHIGPYKRLQKIGEGGMGVVYMAEQETPIRRQVALKIIKPGLDSDQVIARFEAERQALALMDHPGIAKVLDAGTTDTGRHYFVMELVHGIPITDYCDRTQLTLAERLELFICVCQAIQHAHQKGIIHRDIKPSNVLVTLHDGRPVTKVIDFGLAKAIDQRLTERTLFTQFGEVIGTLEYMSPEQAEMGSLDIDTRSDIYSLGVVLYELLTGSTPLGATGCGRRPMRRSCGGSARRRRPKPSSRLSESAAALATIAAQRETEPARLAKLVRGELDWIVMRAVEKDRTRRYETAGGLARDVERFLRHEPVEAGPPSARYRMSKFARRHRTALRDGRALRVTPDRRGRGEHVLGHPGQASRRGDEAGAGRGAGRPGEDRPSAQRVGGVAEPGRGGQPVPGGGVPQARPGTGREQGDGGGGAGPSGVEAAGPVRRLAPDPGGIAPGAW